ncbi:AtzH-like domain-containing protein [Nocardioides sp.]|uniref:AtzH-like domain-containing protein n=1 Tax=Nocardioides sp. TaxID=35761 RepID=UPI0026393426|nr:AtzH-like domain-containing protein [Nocardioides sp.]
MSDPHDTLQEAFWAYERALMANDLAELDRLFAPGPGTLRGDANGLLVGHDQISAFRGNRAVPADGKPWRRIVQTHVQAIDADHALIVAVTELATGGRGQQSQLWARLDDGWKVTAAHVSVPAPALDTRIWRVVGDPLVAGDTEGDLAGESVAVKDLYAVAGQPIGAGNPAWLAQATPETTHAWAVQRLLDEGADVRGIARTDEFAYSLAGTNAHYSTPPNPQAPYRISGGSSSGSASAVSLGQASIGLGTDTGGSIRVPAAYQGLYGIRTSHGAIPVDGLLPLAPTFDTVGWMTRDAALLASVGEALLPGSHRVPSATPADLVVVDSLLDLAQPDVAAAIRAWIDALPAAPRRERWDADLEAWRQVYVTFQAQQAWDVHGAWLATRLDTLGDDVRARFETARDVTDEAAEAAAEAADVARDAIRAFVGDRILVLPAASSVAPRPSEDTQAIREATMRLTSIAGLGGLPAVTVPLTTAEGLPCGVCLIAAPGRDKDVLSVVKQLTRF